MKKVQNKAVTVGRLSRVHQVRLDNDSFRTAPAAFDLQIEGWERFRFFVANIYSEQGVFDDGWTIYETTTGCRITALTWDTHKDATAAVADILFTIDRESLRHEIMVRNAGRRPAIPLRFRANPSQ